MNIDDAELCVYPKSIGGEKNANTKPHPIPQKLKKEPLKVYLMMFPGLVASCPQIEKQNDFASVYGAWTAKEILSQRGHPLYGSIQFNFTPYG